MNEILSGNRLTSVVTDVSSALVSNVDAMGIVVVVVPMFKVELMESDDDNDNEFDGRF